MQVELLEKEAEYRTISANHHLNEFVNSLKLPRVIMLLVPAGKIVDEVIHDLLPLLAKNDLLIDCGNSHFTDTNVRYNQLAKSAIHFMGVGISGGESGARLGPSIMPGGSKGDYDREMCIRDSTYCDVLNNFRSRHVNERRSGIWK